MGERCKARFNLIKSVHVGSLAGDDDDDDDDDDGDNSSNNNNSSL